MATAAMDVNTKSSSLASVSDAGAVCSDFKNCLGSLGAATTAQQQQQQGQISATGGCAVNSLNVHSANQNSDVESAVTRDSCAPETCSTSSNGKSNLSILKDNTDSAALACGRGGQGSSCCNSVTINTRSHINNEASSRAFTTTMAAASNEERCSNTTSPRTGGGSNTCNSSPSTSSKAAAQVTSARLEAAVAAAAAACVPAAASGEGSSGGATVQLLGGNTESISAQEKERHAVGASVSGTDNVVVAGAAGCPTTGGGGAAIRGGEKERGPQHSKQQQGGGKWGVQQQRHIIGHNAPLVEMKLFVGRIPFSFDGEALRPIFEEFGEVREVFIIRDKQTSKHKNSAFVKMASLASADACIRALHGTRVLDPALGPIMVKYATGEAERLGLLHHQHQSHGSNSNNSSGEGGGGVDQAKLFVGSIPRSMCEEGLRQFFSTYGHVDEVFIMRDSATGLGRGCAFVKFKYKEEGLYAIRSLHGRHLFDGCNRPVEVRFAETRAQRQMQQHHTLHGMMGAAWDGLNQTGGGSGGLLLGGGGAPGAQQQQGRVVNSQQQHLRHHHLHPAGGVGGGGNHLAAAGTNSHPRQAGQWKEYYAPDGRPYYHNELTTVTTWERPPEFDLLAPLSVLPHAGGAAGGNRTSSNRGAMGVGGRFTVSSGTAGSDLVGLKLQQLQHHHHNCATLGVGGPETAGPPGANVFVFHIPHDWGKSELVRAFASFGNILSCHVAVDKVSSRNRGFAFVSFDNVQSAANAVNRMNGCMVGNKRLNVSIKKGEEHFVQYLLLPQNQQYRGNVTATGGGTGGAIGIANTSAASGNVASNGAATSGSAGTEAARGVAGAAITPDGFVSLTNRAAVLDKANNVVLPLSADAGQQQQLHHHQILQQHQSVASGNMSAAHALQSGSAPGSSPVTDMMRHHPDMVAAAAAVAAVAAAAEQQQLAAAAAAGNCSNSAGTATCQSRQLTPGLMGGNIKAGNDRRSAFGGQQSWAAASNAAAVSPNAYNAGTQSPSFQPAAATVSGQRFIPY